MPMLTRGSPTTPSVAWNARELQKSVEAMLLYDTDPAALAGSRLPEATTAPASAPRDGMVA